MTDPQMVLLGVLAGAFLAGMGYAVAALATWLRYIRRRRAHFLQHGHRRTTCLARQPAAYAPTPTAAPGPAPAPPPAAPDTSGHAPGPQ